MKLKQYLTEYQSQKTNKKLMQKYNISQRDINIAQKTLAKKFDTK